MLALRPLLGTFVHMPAANADMWERLPEEVVLHILSFLDITDVVHLQLLSSRYLAIARDHSFWKTQCFIHSRAEDARRRQQRLTRQDPRLVELRDAVTALPNGDQLSGRRNSRPTREGDQRASTNQAAEAHLHRNRALANWEPGYPHERLDYYSEYIHRHAHVSIAWIDVPGAARADRDEWREATGVGILADQQDTALRHVIAPLDDGRVCIWDISAQSPSRTGGGAKLVAQSHSGLLTGGAKGDATAASRAIMTETGAVECVSLDNQARKAYFAVGNCLQEVDLNTLQISSTRQYPFPITALSDKKGRAPLTVGTNWTIHLDDPRDPAFASPATSSAGELIGGSKYSHATLTQPGPLSILNHDGFCESDSSIWVAGRFTSLLNYDRRFFPRLCGTIFSGARIASLCAKPYPFIPQGLDLLRHPSVTISARQATKSELGTTILAAAEYKGKGSLELYGLRPNASDDRSLSQHWYHNRQTASASKLLSVASHGGRIVFSDGDGHIKWVERDGHTHVRTININDLAPSTPSLHLPSPSVTNTYSVFSSTSADEPGHGDIVQKISPLVPTTTSSTNTENLLLWTGDGRLGILGFGAQHPRPTHDADDNSEEWHDALDTQAQTAEQRARQDAERQYGMAMRRALQRNADEVRFVRGLGMEFVRD